jgi:uncharacterized HAD superfamily protein
MMNQATNPIPENDKLENFLLSEYNNIAKAHFKTIETISEFLKHYLTIISIPITILVVVLNIDSVRTAASTTITSAAFTAAALFVIVSVVGLMVLWHIINLRMDALLYARTVNGVRKYFYDQGSNLDIATKVKLRTLPQSPLLPAYREFSFFGPVVLIFALLNTPYFYLACAVFAFLARGGANPFGHPAVIVLSSFFFTAHVGTYLFLARHREDAYLRSNILGVDIDGVLNQHRKQFCRLLQLNTGKELGEGQITVIPIHDSSALGITRDDEKLVFNDPNYWTEMCSVEGAADILNRLRSSMRLKIHIFTHRPWPVTVGLPRAERKRTERIWANASRTYTHQVYRDRPWWRRLLSWFRSIGQMSPYRILRLTTVFQKQDWVDRITKAWLNEHGFQYDKIMIEKGSEDAADPSSHIINRFYACRMKKVKYFVEDDLVKAKKLAFICDVVFLFDHPYNQADQLPANVIRVQSWDEILRYMREIW